MNPLAANREVFESTLPAFERLVLLVLIDHLPNCEPSVARIVARSGLSDKTVRRTLLDLEYCGLIRVERVTGKRSQYVLELENLHREGAEPRSSGPRSHRPRSERPRSHSPKTPVPQTAKVSKKVTNDHFGGPRVAASPRGEDFGLTAPLPSTPCESELKDQAQPLSGTPTAKEAKVTPAKARRSAKPESQIDQRVRPLIQYHSETFAREFGNPPAENYGRAAAAIKRLPADITIDTLRRAVDIQLTQRRRDHFVRGSDRVTLAEILASLDTILAWSSRGQGAVMGTARASVIEDHTGGYR